MRSCISVSLNQQQCILSCWVTIGCVPSLLTIMSPRLMSMSSSSRMETDSGVCAASNSLSACMMAFTVLVSPEGSTRTVSPLRSTPPASRPA